MGNLLDKSFSFGLGLFAYSKEKIEGLVQELADKGEIAKNDAKEVVSDLVKKGDEQKECLKQMIRDEYERVKGDISKSMFSKEVKDEIRSMIREEVLSILKEKELIKEDSNK